MDSRNKVIVVARAELGYREEENNNTKFGKWYGMNYNPWCAMFVSWCADRAGVATDVIPKFAYVPHGVAFFKRQNRWRFKGSYTPQTGDIIFFGDEAHVGLVEKVENGNVFTIEGNTGASGNSSNGDGVYRRKRALTNSWIMGYGVPDYPKEKKMNIISLKIRDLVLGKDVEVSAVNIDGSNYIKLRDMEKLVAVKVDYDEVARIPIVRKAE